MSHAKISFQQHFKLPNIYHGTRRAKASPKGTKGLVTINRSNQGKNSIKQLTCIIHLLTIPYPPSPSQASFNLIWEVRNSSTNRSVTMNRLHPHAVHDVALEIGRARTVYKGLYDWPNETIGKQHKQCPQSHQQKRCRLTRTNQNGGCKEVQAIPGNTQRSLFVFIFPQNFIRRCLVYRKEERADVLTLCEDPYLKPPVNRKNTSTVLNSQT